MINIAVDFNKPLGRIKPMHAVNNGPVYKFAEDQRITNIDSYRAAGIPYARTHDASINYTYGGEHVVDVHGIFPDFSKDPYDPASYDFCLTDDYLKVIDFAGAKTFYRLGSKIEHWSKKYGTLPPPDFKKWAVICEHIIRHYTEGWADGFCYDIEYWEIWNEPDLDADDSTHKRCWGGTKAQFFELYDVAARHLKECFPHLKIGGPALAGNLVWLEDFLAQLKAPLDFLSWHIYAKEPAQVIERAEKVRALMDKYGFGNAESILNEWNYVRGWEGDDWIYSLKREKDIKGAAFIAAVMEESQKSSIDLLMYYDARPGGMNGLYNTDIICETLKGYYPFFMFNKLYKLGSCVCSEADEAGIYACAAKGDEGAAVMLTCYSDDDNAEGKRIRVELKGIGPGRICCSLLDRENDLAEKMRFEITGDDAVIELDVPHFGSYLITKEAI